MNDRDARLAKAQFIIGSLKGLIRMAEDERMDMLAYLLEMALTEAVTLEEQAQAGK